MNGVEFVADDHPVDDLPPPRPAASRVTWTARIVAVVSAVAAIAVWVATRPSPPAPVQRVDPATILQQHPGIRKHAQPLGLTLADNHGVICHLGAPVDNGVTAAMHKFLQHIVIENMLATRCIATSSTSRRVVAELIIGTTGRYDVQVAISDRNAEFAPVPSLTGGGSRQAKVPLGRVEVESAGVRVRISATGFAHNWPKMLRLQRLADFLSLNTVL